MSVVSSLPVGVLSWPAVGLGTLSVQGQLQISPKLPQRNVLTLCNWTASWKGTQVLQRTWRCQGFFPHWGEVESSSVLRGRFLEKALRGFLFPSAQGSVCRPRQCPCALQPPFSCSCTVLPDAGGWVSLDDAAVQILTTFILSPFAGKISQTGRNPSKGRDQPQAEHLSWLLRPSSTSGFGQPWLRRCWTRLCSTLLITAGKESSRSTGLCWIDAFRCLQQGISSEVFGKPLWCRLLVRWKAVT